MRIGELSRQAGVPIPTIKYYLREGLLPPGEITRPNQARYDERHVRRLRLVRALVDVGRVPIAAIRALFAEIDRTDQDPHHMLGKTLRAVSGAHQPAEEKEATSEEAETEELIARRGWRISPTSPARRTVAEVILTLRQLGLEDFLAVIDEYAEAAERAATTDLELVRARGQPEAMVYAAVVGTILGDRLMAGLRHLAQEDVSARTLGRNDDPGGYGRAEDDGAGGGPHGG
jgi:DNA-binding transcriptional MerR regulator